MTRELAALTKDTARIRQAAELPDIRLVRRNQTGDETFHIYGGVG